MDSPHENHSHINNNKDDDPRSCPPDQLLRVMHRTMLLCPVLGLPNEYEELCVPLVNSPCVNRSDNPQPAQQQQQQQSLYTWMAKGCRLVTIIKIAPSTTVFWDHATNTSFKASPACALGPGCPIGTSLLGQVVMDRLPGSSTANSDEEEWRINVLIFDIQTYGADISFLSKPRPASVRYALLREISDDHPESCVFTSERVKVQWAGQLDALMQFHAREGPTFPHIIDCYMRLGDALPTQVSLEMC